MTKLKSLLAGVVIAALAFGLGAVWAQQITSRTLTGNETWTVAVGGPQGPSMFTTVAQMRNTTGVQTTALTTGTFSTPITTSNVIMLGAVTALTVNLPPLPYDGQIFELTNGTGSTITAPTIASTDGSTIVNGSAGPTLAGASFEWRYVISTTSWYKMR